MDLSNLAGRIDFNKESNESAAVEKVKESTRVIVDLQTAINRLDILVFALFKLLQEKGVSEDELTEMVEGIIKDYNSDVYAYNPIMCSKCNMPLQETKQIPMLGKCLYCGEQHVLYPYPRKKSADEISAEETAAENASAPEVVTPSAEAEPEPYDVLKDLRFDEE